MAVTLLKLEREMKNDRNMIQIGFIGLGKMGYLIAGRISKYYKVFIYNRTMEKSIKHCEEYQTIIIQNINDFQHLNYIFTCLPSSKESNYLFKQLHKNSKLQNTTFIDLSSGDYQSTLEISSYLTSSRRFFDAPISGGPKGAKEGTLTSIIGVSSLTSIENEIISTYSKKIIVCGSVGFGNAIKGANNYLNMTHLILASDVLIQLQKKGISPEIALDVINHSSGRSLQTEQRIPNEVITRQFNYGFKLNLMRKDIFQSKPLLKDSLFYNKVEELLQNHETTIEDYTTIVKDIERRNGIELKSNKPPIDGSY